MFMAGLFWNCWWRMDISWARLLSSSLISLNYFFYLFLNSCARWSDHQLTCFLTVQSECRWFWQNEFFISGLFFFWCFDPVGSRNQASLSLSLTDGRSDTLCRCDSQLLITNHISYIGRIIAQLCSMTKTLQNKILLFSSLFSSCSKVREKK